MTVSSHKEPISSIIFLTNIDPPIQSNLLFLNIYPNEGKTEKVVTPRIIQGEQTVNQFIHKSEYDLISDPTIEGKIY